MTRTSVAQPDRVAAVLATRSRWVHGRRRSDSREFWILPASDGGRTYYADARACTCPAARTSRSGECKHQLAIREYLAVERPAPAPRRDRYAAIFGADD